MVVKEHRKIPPDLPKDHPGYPPEDLTGDPGGGAPRIARGTTWGGDPRAYPRGRSRELFWFWFLDTFGV